MVSENRSIQISIRVICLHSPQETCPEKDTVFGLQDKAQNLLSGQMAADGGLQFECTVVARSLATMSEPNLSGVYVHGTPIQRFLYLSLGRKDNDQWHWIRRIKIPLSGITWQHIETALTGQRILEATIDGQRAGTVSLLGMGWIPC